VQIPGSSTEDHERAVQLIQSAAFLEFSMVHENNDDLVRKLFDKGLAPEGFQIATEGRRGGSDYYQRTSEPQAEDWREKISGFQAPPGYRFMLEERVVEGHKRYIPYFVRQRSELKGSAVRLAKVEYGPGGQPYVALEFDAKGARRFANITSDYAPGGARNPNPNGRRYLGIIMDGRLYSAPFIKTAIHGGEAMIEGNFTLKEAQDLVIVLRAGSLPTPVKIIESRTVDPSLGRDSITSGLRAAFYSGMAVIVFMLIYYSWGGLIADIGLICNMLLLPLGMMITAGVMGLFSGAAGSSVGLPVLTLPGIAGIVLTIGMAVDANVLIFERIREEQNLGKRFGPAVVAGYDKAFITILDSNLTTIMAAVLLFIFGTGPVRGFGVTLTAGIIVSMYTALVVSRMIFDLIIRSGKVKTLRMLDVFNRIKNINFLAFYKPAVILSLIVVVICSVTVGLRAAKDPTSIFGTDFTGGASLTFTFDNNQKPTVAAIRDALADAGVNEAQIQYQRELDGSAERLQLRTDAASADLVKQTLAQGFESADFKLLNEDLIGPQIGNEMVARAGKALLFSLIGMVVYISWRFQFAYAVGGIVALIHDVLICVGVYCLLGRQINMTVVAGVMTIVGYSINDTIVIFDRIREKLKVQPRIADDFQAFRQLCNTCLNETLSRTILTSLTTFLAVTILLVFGGGAINDFALVLFLGIIAGTYSTIYIAVPVMLKLYRAQSVAKTTKK
jgi:SecD/SecF fusion protein